MNNTAPVPTCIGIVMDGNRRWARAQGKPVFEGHSAGYKTLQEVLRWARDAKIPHVVAYAFSTENWQRSEEEVGYLMKLFRSILENETNKLVEERVRILFVGDRSRFNAELQKLMKKMEEVTAAARYESTLHLAMSYGGRAEITAAAAAAAAAGTVTEESISKNLWTAGMPDPDLIIRTGGDQRLSNFLPWQSIYSEFFFIDTFWPDFSKETFDSVLAEYAQRERRRGK